MSAVEEQAVSMLGMSMTFTLIEWLKDNSSPLLVKQEERVAEIKATEVTTQINELNINENTTDVSWLS